MTAFEGVKVASKLVAIGVPAGTIPLSIALLDMKGIEILPQVVGTRQDLREVFALAAAGKLRCRTSTVTLEQANDTLAALGRGAVTGRAVIQFEHEGG